MPWIQIRISCPADQTDFYQTQMTELGAHAVTFMDAFDQPIYEPKPGETKLWGTTQVTGLFSADADTIALEKALKKNKISEKNIVIEALEDKDWVREWMQYFQPMQFGSHLWICPSWKACPEPNAVNVMLDPGVAFGTGTHPTTALCLHWLAEQNLQGLDVIDYGCGSGILAIAALKLGAIHAYGIDIDQQALDASQENARRNQIDHQVTTYLPDQAPKELHADIVIANILAAPLQKLAPKLATHVKPGGYIILSGMLESQVSALQVTYSQWFTLETPMVEDEWGCLVGKRNISS